MSVYDENSALNAKVKKLEEELKKLEEDLKDAKELLYQNEIERKVLSNEMNALRGNVRVNTRIRPVIAADVKKPLHDWEISNEHHPSEQSKFMGQIFDSEFFSEEIFGEVKPLVQFAIDGNKACVMSYGEFD